MHIFFFNAYACVTDLYFQKCLVWQPVQNLLKNFIVNREILLIINKFSFDFDLTASWRELNCIRY